jgi:hypothetical protein
MGVALAAGPATSATMESTLERCHFRWEILKPPEGEGEGVLLFSAFSTFTVDQSSPETVVAL